MKYRNRSSYVSKDPENRARSLANLKRGKKPGTLPEIIEKAVAWSPIELCWRIRSADDPKVGRLAE